MKKRIVYRGSQKLLILPDAPKLACRGLELYPAQRILARVARGGLGLALRLHLPLGALIRHEEIHFPPGLLAFAQRVAGTQSSPQFACLYGNPDALGQRLIWMLFNEEGNPCAVLKVGQGTHAQTLVKQERDFLLKAEGGRRKEERDSQQPVSHRYAQIDTDGTADTRAEIGDSLKDTKDLKGFNGKTDEQRHSTVAGVAIVATALCRRAETAERRHSGVATDTAFDGIVALLDSWEEGEWSAIALEYLEGTTPANDDWDLLEKILTGWLSNERLPLRSIPAWQRLSNVAEGSTLETVRAIEDSCVCSAIYHGDFAPWNVRKTAAGLRALDWERGESLGVPGWDWFHWVTHISILVRRDTNTAWVEKSLYSEQFLRYAECAGISPIITPLFHAYLAYAKSTFAPASIHEQLTRLSSTTSH